MNNTRRGFLKTLGKLGAALGLTVAACSSTYHRKPTGSPDDGFHLASEAKPRTTPKAKTAVNGQMKAELKMGFTGFKKAKTTPLTYKALEDTYKQAARQQSRHQEWLNRITMARIDNISAVIKPEILLKDLIPTKS